VEIGGVCPAIDARKLGSADEVRVDGTVDYVKRMSLQGSSVHHDCKYVEELAVLVSSTPGWTDRGRQTILTISWGNLATTIEALHLLAGALGRRSGFLDGAKPGLLRPRPPPKKPQFSHNGPSGLAYPDFRFYLGHPLPSHCMTE
jgi:hypothetical protein